MGSEDLTQKRFSQLEAAYEKRRKKKAKTEPPESTFSPSQQREQPQQPQQPQQREQQPVSSLDPAPTDVPRVHNKDNDDGNEPDTRQRADPVYHRLSPSIMRGALSKPLGLAAASAVAVDPARVRMTKSRHIDGILENLLSKNMSVNAAREAIVSRVSGKHVLLDNPLATLKGDPPGGPSTIKDNKGRPAGLGLRARKAAIKQKWNHVKLLSSKQLRALDLLPTKKKVKINKNDTNGSRERPVAEEEEEEEGSRDAVYDRERSMTPKATDKLACLDELREAWGVYMKQLLQEANVRGEVICKAEYVGGGVKVVEARDVRLVGVEGIVVRESRDNLVIYEDRSRRLIIVPLKETILHLVLPKPFGKARLYGNKLRELRNLRR